MRPTRIFAVAGALRRSLTEQRAYMTAEVFVDIGYIAGVECISFGRARWLKTGRTGLSLRAPLTFWT